MRPWFAALFLSVAACSPASPAAAPLAERIDAASARAVDYLVSSQDEDGAWRSRTYGALKDGWSLTATCTKALLFAPTHASGVRAAERGLEFLAGALDAQGEIDSARLRLPYPVYTSALAVVCFARAAPADPGRWRAPREAWLRYLCAQQLGPELGWTPADAPWGGWSYAPNPARAAEPRSFESDLSSTLFALGALRTAGVGADDARVVRALAFVQRCQNLPLDGEPPDPLRDDGGFFMSPSVPLQDKAGGAFESHGRLRFSSYGSMTADGLRALLRCGLGPQDARVRAALGWITVHFNAGQHPGRFDAVRAGEREAAWYYWSWSVAHALVELGVPGLERPDGRVHWSTALAEGLLARQSADGSWSNPYTLVKEDDPLVATPLALAALTLARLSAGAAAR